MPKSLKYDFGKNVIVQYFTIDEIDNIQINDYIEKYPTLQAALGAKYFPTWEEYYAKRHIKQPGVSNADELSSQITARVEKWQKKDEFETTAEWKARVTEESRAAMVEQLKHELTTQAVEANKAYKEEADRLLAQYKRELKAHNDPIIDDYYSMHTAKRKRDFAKESFALNAPYDADNGSFLISTTTLGDILLPVPRAEAPEFKQNWTIISKNIEPTFVPDGDDVALNKLTFTNGDKTYVYDSHTQAKYAVTDIDYNFTPIQIEESDFNNIGDLNLAPIAVQTVAQTIQTIHGADRIVPREVETERVSLKAGNVDNVDTEIPERTRNNRAQNTFALIVANENYRREPSVPHARNDGRILAEYMKKTLGLPDNCVQLVSDATLNDIISGLDWLETTSRAFDGDASVIVYYAGHGIPDESSREAYLLPVDGYSGNTRTCFNVSELYEKLAAMPTKQTTVFMDACFSGANRDDRMLREREGIRAVRIKPKHSAVSGNLVVLSATESDETAMPYSDKRHGMFTYFLLKKLQETKGDTTLGELSDYIIEKVRRTSVLMAKKVQTPTVMVSPSVSDWKSRRL